MADEPIVSYGYSEDKVEVSSLTFGLNAGKTFLKEFKYIPNGGKDGAEQDALEIIFEINGDKVSYRKFPVTEAFLKGNKGKTSDPNTPEFKAAIADFEGVMTHIASTFMDRESYKAATSKRFISFKDFVDTVAKLLPTNYNTIPLDIFLQWQSQFGKNQNRTFLEIPKNMRSGYWLCKAQEGDWTEVITNKTPKDADRDVFFYYDAEKGKKDETKKDTIENFNSVHLFTRSGYFINGKTFSQQVDANASTGDNIATNNNVAANGTATGDKPAEAAVW